MCEIVDITRRYVAAAKIRCNFGMRGYGVYCAIVGLIDANPERRLKYDLAAFAWELREEQDYIKKIVEDSGLFLFDDGNILDAFLKTPEYQERERQEQARLRRSESAKKAAATRKAKKEAAEASRQPNFLETPPHAVVVKDVVTPTPATAVQTATQEEDDFNWDDLPSYSADSSAIQSGDKQQSVFDKECYKRFEDIRAYWNEVFIKSGRPSRAFHDLEPSSVIKNELLETFRQYSNEDIKRAFDYAAKQEFIWQFYFTIKAYNIRKLLCEEEQEEWKEEASLTQEQRELIQFLDDQGIEEYEVAKRGKKKRWQQQ